MRRALMVYMFIITAAQSLLTASEIIFATGHPANEAANPTRPRGTSLRVTFTFPVYQLARNSRQATLTASHSFNYCGIEVSNVVPLSLTLTPSSIQYIQGFAKRRLAR